MIVFPIAEFSGGHIYEVGGYGTVYVTSLFVCTCGLLYVIVVVPDDTGQSIKENEDEKSEVTGQKSDSNSAKRFKKETDAKFLDDKGSVGLLRKMTFMFRKGNKTIVESYR